MINLYAMYYMMLLQSKLSRVVSRKSIWNANSPAQRLRDIEYTWLAISR